MYSNKEIQTIKTISKKYICNDNLSNYHYFSTLGFFFITLYFLSSNNFIIYGFAFIFTILFKIRLFMIFHDLCHGSYFMSDERKTKKNGINLYIARCINCISVYFAADDWKKFHSEHHEAHGNMNKVDGARTLINDKEYESLPPLKKRLYDIIRYPPFFL